MKELPGKLCRLALLLLVATPLACNGDDEKSAPQPDAASTEKPVKGQETEETPSAQPMVEPIDPPASTLTVSSPPDVGKAQIPVSAFMDLGSSGYKETEFFFEGQAAAYKPAGELAMDGKWTLSEAASAPFRTRLYVRQPIDPAKFNGTVVVEWLNVSGGADGDPGYMYNHQMALREGWVWIAVSAQKVGIDGGGIGQLAGIFGGMGMMGSMASREGVFGAPLKEFDPQRYKTLVHPGDDYSYDIFSQAARLVRGEGDGPDLLDGLEPTRVIAYGESQSAGRLTSYVNGVHGLGELFDGYFIHSRGASGSGFSTDASNPFAGFLGGGTPHHIRDDVGVPVFQFQTETDVHGMLAFLPARQPDTDMLRTWEVAGTAHADAYLVELGGDVASSVGLDCKGANDGPQQYVIKAALKSLDRWIADGTAPVMGKVLEVDGTGKAVLDASGNTVGGVRSPDVDVPIAVHSGSPPANAATPDLASGNPLSFFCGVFGSTTPFTPEKLMELYPTHDDYVQKVEASAKASVDAGYLLPEEADAMIEEAKAAAVPN